MAESEQHRTWKTDLFNLLRRKVSGCVGCQFGYAPDEHLPAYAWGNNHPRGWGQDIMWVCDKNHHHTFDLLLGAGAVVEETELHAPVTGKYRPDIAILDTHYEPIAFVEIVYKNRRSKVRKAGEELEVPVFSVLAPNRRSLQPNLHGNRPWWESTDMPEDLQRQAAFMQDVSDEMMGRNGDTAGLWAELEVYRDEDKAVTSFRGSPPSFSHGAFPTWGDKVLAEWCSWDCETAWKVAQQRDEIEADNAAISSQIDLFQQLGRIAFESMRRATDRTVRHVIPLGVVEAHVEMSLQPLDSNVPADDPKVLRLYEQLHKAEQKVRERWQHLR